MAKRQNFDGQNPNGMRLGDYHLGATLGEGEFGKVKTGWKKDSNNQVAVKLIRKEKLDSHSRMTKVHREIAILRQLDHPHIVHLYETVETDRTIGIILDYASGGELFDYILKKKHLDDNRARRLFAQLISGVGYLHRNGIIHRDLKLENLLLDSKHNIIITDFGFANTFDPTARSNSLHDQPHENPSGRGGEYENEDGVNQFSLMKGHKHNDLMKTSCGSPCYAAPELVVSDGLYCGRKVDVWSCGIILYAMLAGYLPWDDDSNNPDGDNINLLYRYICNTQLVFPNWVSAYARDILKQILVPDPHLRADLFTIARHSWLMDYASTVEHITSNTQLSSEEYERVKALKLPVYELSHARGQAKPVNEKDQGAKVYKYSEPTGSQRRAPENADRYASGGESDTKEALDAQRKESDRRRKTVQIEYSAPQTSPKNAIEPVASFEGTTAPGVLQERRNSNPQPMTTHKRESLSAGVDMRRERDPRAAQATMQPAYSRSSQYRPMSVRADSYKDQLSTEGAMGGIGKPTAAKMSYLHAKGQVSAPPKKERDSQGRLEMPPSVEGPRPGTQPQSQAQPEFKPPSRSHKRSSTLGQISDKILNRGSSVSRRGGKAQPPQKPDRSRPPPSMPSEYFDGLNQPSDQNEQAPGQQTTQPKRKSMEQVRRSFGFSRKSSDSSALKSEKKRFSILPTRKFNDTYDQKKSSGSSGASRRVMEFFRRR